MQDMIRQGMVEGAVGLSTGLLYPLGIYASTGELVPLVMCHLIPFSGEGR